MGVRTACDDAVAGAAEEEATAVNHDDTIPTLNEE